MIIEMPTEINVTLEKAEKEAIHKCMNVLTGIQNTMEKHDCDILTTDYDDSITYGDIDDIIADLNRLVNAVIMH